MSKIQEKEIRRAAMNLLARREHSKKELLEKLSKRFSGFELLVKQLDLLEGEGLQSDRRFTESYVRYRSQGGQGPVRIDQELRKRGIEDSLLQEFLWNADIDWNEIIYRVYSKKFVELGILDQKEKAKRVRFLQYRGFGFDLIQQVVN